MADKLDVALLGATGLVGQHFVELLHKHPWFNLEIVAASPGKAGLRYGEAVDWMLGDGPPEVVAEMRLAKLDLKALDGVDLVFSALPSDVAVKWEPVLAREGFRVISNSSAMRLEPDVPLVNPEVNPDHLGLIKVQKKARGWRGFLVKSPNCTTTILTLVLKPLMDAYGLKRAWLTTMQAISGAGLRGIYAMQILGNIIPFIPGEEEKITREARKILGRISSSGHVEPMEVEISATCTRVPVHEGHLLSVFLKLEDKPSGLVELAEVLREFSGVPQTLRLPTAPPKPVIVQLKPDRPQPRIDWLAGKGMAVTVGRIGWINDNDGFKVKLLVLGSNTVRGAAGGAVLLGELLKVWNFL